MASPQLEEGFLQLSNELAERMAAACLTDQEMSVMLLIARFAYGVQKRRSVPLPIAALAQYLDINKSGVSRLLKKMESKELIECMTRRTGTRASEYRIQKNWELWKCSRKSSWPRLIVKKRGFIEDPLSCAQSATLADRPETPKRNSSDQNSQLYDAKNATLDVEKRNSRGSSPADENATSATPIKDKGQTRIKPPTPKGSGGDSSDDLDQEKDRLKKLAKLLLGMVKIIPTAKDVAKVDKVLRTKVPDGWQATPWKQHCRAMVNESLASAKDDHDAGQEFGSVYAIACTRASAKLQRHALNPEEFEGDYDETA